MGRLPSMSGDTSSADPYKGPGKVISARFRVCLGVGGVASWIAGGWATFTANNGSGAVALVAIGALAAALSLIGRWPNRVAVSGHEMAWDDVKSVVEESAQYASDSASAAELRDLLERLSQMNRTGHAPQHPAQLYDSQVESALRLAAPTATVARTVERSRLVPDFLLRSANELDLAVETKWRPEPDAPFRGSTLQQLIEKLPATQRLLVVTNAFHVEAVQALLETSMPGRAAVTRWQESRDDDKLKRAISSLTQHTS